jgi:hypothetical protein
MAKLMRASNEILLSDLKIADRMWSRMRGLLGNQGLSSQEGLWIHRCNSIHTFFMNYAIDCVFMDSEMRVKALKKDIQPGKLVFPILGAQSVIEMKSGQIENLGLRLGEQLHVGT